jgi:hypothetical protein
MGERLDFYGNPIWGSNGHDMHDMRCENDEDIEMDFRADVAELTG